MAYSQPMSRRRRATALGLTVAIHILVALIVWNLAPDVFFRPTSDSLATFDVSADSGEAPQPAAAQRAERRPERAQQRPTPPRATLPPPPPPKVELPIPEYLRMTRDQFAATDLSKLPKTAPPRDGADDGQSANAAAGAGDSASTYGPGAGPGGARLFNAEWVREPTDAEMRPFMPPAPAGSWAMVACRTIPNNRVENCQILGESPLGSKLATGLRRAAWQFQVRPPRLGGKPMIGEWVRIRFDFTDRGIEVRR